MVETESKQSDDNKRAGNYKGPSGTTKRNHDCWEWAVFSRENDATRYYVCVKCRRELFRDRRAKK